MATADSLTEPKKISPQCATNCHQKRCNSTINDHFKYGNIIIKGNSVDSNRFLFEISNFYSLPLWRSHRLKFFCKNGLHGNFIGYTVCVKFYLKKQKQMQILTRLLIWAIRDYSIECHSYHLIQSRQMTTDIYISYHFTK